MSYLTHIGHLHDYATTHDLDLGPFRHMSGRAATDTHVDVHQDASCENNTGQLTGAALRRHGVFPHPCQQCTGSDVFDDWSRVARLVDRMALATLPDSHVLPASAVFASLLSNYQFFGSGLPTRAQCGPGSRRHSEPLPSPPGRR